MFCSLFLVASWGVDDRFSSYRMKNFGPTSSYVENRIPSGTANPYLIMAVTIAAGLDGMANKLEPPAQRDAKSAQKMPSYVTIFTINATQPVRTAVSIALNIAR